MNELTCLHGNGPECSKCKALDIPEVEELEARLDGYRATCKTLRATLHRTELRNDELKLEAQLARRERDEAKAWKVEYIRQVAEKDEQVAEVHGLLFKAEAARAALATPGPSIAEIKAEALEVVATALSAYVAPEPPSNYWRGVTHGHMAAVKELRAEAARLRGGGA